MFIKKNRDKNKIFVVEGKKLLLEAINESLEINDIICTKDFFDNNSDILKDYKDKIVLLSDTLFKNLTEMTNSEGVISVIKYFENRKIVSKNVLLLDNVSDPGNFGTIIRTANAFGFNDILTINCVDIYNTKVLRATMGALFRVNICKVEIEDIVNLGKIGYRIISTSLSSESKNLEEYSFEGNNIIVIGNESNGVSKEILKTSDDLLKIEMDTSMESLNVSIASSIIMYKIFSKNKKW